MTLHTPSLVRRILELRVVAALMNVCQGMQVIFGNNLVISAEVARLIELLYGCGVAVATNSWRNQYRYKDVSTIQGFMLGCHRRVCGHLMAIDTGNANVGVPAVLPVGDLSRRDLLVAVDSAFSSFIQVPLNLQSFYLR